MTDFEFFSSSVSEKIKELSALSAKANSIDASLYDKYDVKRGLRDINGKGVVAGLTEICEIISSEKNPDGTTSPCAGELYYRGIDVKELIKNAQPGSPNAFEETSYLLLFGKLPTAAQLKEFTDILTGFRTLPVSFVRDIIMKAPSIDIMNVLARGVLTLYSYDDKADDISLANVMRQSLQLIAQFPLLSVYGYQVYSHYYGNSSLVIHKPSPDYSCAENILHLLRPDSKFSPLEAKLLDIALVLHAEHGGGNNSSFTTHVVTSSGTDTYSAIAASLGSLKGPRHGGANLKVIRMFEDMKSNLPNRSDGAVRDYLARLVDKQAFDNSGLIYGIGHAVYSLSDPRAEVFKGFVEMLAEEKGCTEDFELYQKIEKLAPEIIAEKRRIFKGVSANVDFYSGFAYSMLGLPEELYTPIFAIARIVGWSSHRLEELTGGGKIIRPGYQSVAGRQAYIPMDKR